MEPTSPGSHAGAGPGAGVDSPFVPLCNKMLAAAGLVAKVSTEDEVKIICSKTSLFVAACEAMAGRKLESIIRRPSSDEERARNCEEVVSMLGGELHTDLSHISGERIVEGSLRDIGDLIEVLAHFSDLVPRDDTSHLGVSQGGSISFKAGSAGHPEVPPLNLPTSTDDDGPMRRGKKGARKGKKRAVVRPLFLVSGTPSLGVAKDGYRRVHRISQSIGTSAAWDVPVTIAAPDHRRASMDFPPVVKKRAGKERKKGGKQQEEGGLLGSSLEVEGADHSKDESMSSVSATERSHYHHPGLAPPRSAPAPRAGAGAGGKQRKPAAARPAGMGGKGRADAKGKLRARDLAQRYKEVLGKPGHGRGRATRPRARGVGVGKDIAGAAEKLGSAPELDRVLAARLKHVLAMRQGDSYDIRVARAAERRTQEFERRAQQRRGMYVHARRAEARHEERVEAAAHRLAERGDRHREKVARVQAERFWSDMEMKDRSRRTTRLAREAELFRGLFMTAVEREKEKIIEDRREARLRRKEELSKEMDRHQQAEAVALDHFAMMEDAIREERMQKAALEKAQKRLVAEMEREARLQLSARRKHLADHIASEEESAYFRRTDPTRVAPELLSNIQKTVSG